MLKTSDEELVTAVQLVNHIDICWMQVETLTKTMNLRLVDFLEIEGIKRLNSS